MSVVTIPSPNSRLHIPKRNLSVVELDKMVENEHLGLPLDFDENTIQNVLLDESRQLLFDNPVLEIMDFMSQPENFYYTCKWLFNIQLLPFQVVLLQELWNRKFPMLVASRGAGKTWVLSLYAVLRAIFHQGCKIVVVGAAFRQSKLLFEYMEQFWRGAPIFRNMVGTGKHQGPKRDVDRCNFYIGESEITAIPLGDGCLYTNTLITTHQSFSQIHQPTREIWGDGRFRESDEHYDNGVKPTKIITTQQGLSFEGTYNHKMKVCRDRKIVWVRSDEMVVGDRILIDRSQRWHGGTCEYDEDRAYFLGTITTKHMKLPKSILGAEQSKMTAYLQGFFDIHASLQIFPGNICVILRSLNKESLRQIQYILLHYGIISKTTEDTHRVEKDNYRLLMTGQEVKKFAEQIGFRFTSKQEILLAGIEDIKHDVLYTDTYYDTITSIKDGESQTYDMHVPDGHEYCANGFFSHNSKIRGLRANYTICDEFSSISQEIFEVVIRGFAAVSASPEERSKDMARIKVLKSLGMHGEAEDVDVGFGNQTILSGTAYYSFNHFYDYWRRYKNIIETQGDTHRLEEIFKGEVPTGFDWKQFGIFRIPWQKLPYGFMDETQVHQARATIHNAIYQMEYGAVFTRDSDGFFKRSLIESCVCDEPIELPSGPVKFTAALRGSPNCRYVYGIDPASEQDNFALVILEVHPDHNRIVYCWSINRQELRERIKQSGKVEQKSFYTYCARKIRDLMKIFPTDHIAIDSQGGGIAIMEALHDADEFEAGTHERPLWPWIKQGETDVFWWEKTGKPTDGEAGNHLLHMVQFAQAEFTSQANHNMRKDFESKITLFPFFDSVTIGEAISLDKIHKRDYDTLEDCVMEIEELKDELATITHTQTTGGRDHWDTPEVKLPGNKKGRLRKDRYSALLIANMICHVMNNELEGVQHTFVGGYAGERHGARGADDQMYVGPNHLVSQMNTGAYGKAVRRS